MSMWLRGMWWSVRFTFYLQKDYLFRFVDLLNKNKTIFKFVFFRGKMINVYDLNYSIMRRVIKLCFPSDNSCKVSFNKGLSRHDARIVEYYHNDKEVLIELKEKIEGLNKIKVPSNFIFY